MHDMFYEMSPFRPIHHQSAQDANILITPVHSVVHPSSFQDLPPLLMPTVKPKITCFICLSYTVCYTQLSVHKVCTAK